MGRGRRRILVGIAVAAAVVVPAHPTAAAPPELRKLLAPDGAAGDQLGTAVAAAGDTVVVGAPFDDDVASNAGAAHVFVRGVGGWTRQATLLAGDGQADDMFGAAVSISGDTVVVGARGDDDKGLSSGSAYVFVRTGSTWSAQAKLLAWDGAGGDLFGGAVSVSGDTVVVGAIGDDDKGSNSGSAYVFTRSGTTWSTQGKLVASDGAAADAFGVAVSVDGDTAVVGSYLDDDRGTNSGSAYVFVRSGAVWSQQAKLVPADGGAGHWFGTSVSLSGDTVAVGASNANDKGTTSGNAHVWVRSGATWTRQAKLVAPDGAAGDQFGISLGLAGDRLVVGAHGDGDNGRTSGSAWIFDRSGASWAATAKVLPDDGASGDVFGTSVAVADGATFYGAPGDDDLGADAGSAYVGEDNRAPDCTGASATPATLWPPDGTMRPVALGGVTDPDGDPVDVTVTGIFQNEPVGLRPDGAGVGTSEAHLRATRHGAGEGRVYRVVLSASDGRGGSCAGEALVTVPKAAAPAKGGAATGDGVVAEHDSTVPAVSLQRPGRV